MELWHALVLGIVEGLTEYLPVSSTGHLLVTQRLLGIPESEAANAYAIVIQAGAIAAVLGLYRERVGNVILGVVGKHPEGAKLARNLVVGFLPAAVLGVLFDEAIEQYLFGPWPVVVAWAVGGILILFIAKKIQARQGLSLEALTWRAALLVGTIQCCAMWPGDESQPLDDTGGFARRARLDRGRGVLVPIGARYAWRGDGVQVARQWFGIDGRIRRAPTGARIPRRMGVCHTCRQMDGWMAHASRHGGVWLVATRRRSLGRTPTRYR